MNVAASVSKIFARLHRWSATAAVLGRVPLAQMDRASVGRLSYALLMVNLSDSGKARALFEGVLSRNASASPQLLLELADMATRIGDPKASSELLNRVAATATDAVTADAARRLHALNIGILDGSLKTLIAARVGALALDLTHDLITLVPVSSRYIDMWQLWLQQTRKHVGGLIMAMAMDDAAMAMLAAESDIAVVDVREFFTWDERGSLHPRTRGVLWYLRVLFLRELVQRGSTVLVLDLDAIAIADVAPMLALLPDADVVAQKDYSIPVDVARQLGFILCCGFMLWRPTAAAKALLDRFAAETAIERDDQLALNHLLGRDGIVRKTENAQCMTFGSAGVQFVCPSASLVSRSLDSGTVIRHFQQEGKSIAELRAALGISS